MKVTLTYGKMNTFPGYSWMDIHQSIYPWSPHPHQNRGHFHPPRKIARSHFVFKLLASERLCVEIIKAKCVGKEPNHQSSTTNTGSEGCGDGARACTDVSAGMGALITCQGPFQGQPHGPLWAALLALDHGTETNGFIFWFCALGIRQGLERGKLVWIVKSTIFSKEQMFSHEEGTTTARSTAFQILLQHRKRSSHDQAN